MTLNQYHVTLYYKTQTTRIEGIFPADFKLSATSPEEAIEKAIREFKEIEAQSGVAWLRKIDHSKTVVRQI